MPSDPLQGLGPPVEARACPLDLCIVDASFPEVTCFEFAGILVVFPEDEHVLAYPVLGWDVLRHFEISLNARRERIGMRLVGGPAAETGAPRFV